MPLGVGQTGTKLDDLPLACLDALIVKLDAPTDLESHDLFAFQVVDSKEHLLRLAFCTKCGQDGKVGRKSIGKELSGWDAGHTPIADGVGDVGRGNSI